VVLRQQLSGHPPFEAGSNGSAALAPAAIAEPCGAEELAAILDHAAVPRQAERPLRQPVAGGDANSLWRAQRVAYRCAAAAGGIALLALAGWLLDVRLLAGQWRGGIPMAPDTALALLFLSGGVFSHARWSTHPLSRRVALSAAGLAAVLGLLVLAQFITGRDWGPVLALARTNELPGRIPLGRMSPFTAAAVFLESGALLFLFHTTRWRFAASVAAVLGLVATVANLVILQSYSYRFLYSHVVPSLYGDATIPVALSTALAMVLVGAGQLTLALPEVPELRAWYGESMRGLLTRSFLPVMLVFSLVQSWVESMIPVSAMKPLWDALKDMVMCILIVAVIALVSRRAGDTIDRVQAALRESEAKFRELFDNAPVAYHELDIDGIVRRVNRTECILLGYEASEILGRPIWDFIAGAELEASRETLRRKLSGVQPLQPHQRRYLQRGGGELWVEVHDCLVRNAAGETVFIRTALLDLSERKRAEADLRASEARRGLLAHALQCAGECISITDTEDRFVYVNEAFSRTYGYREQELIGQHVAMLRSARTSAETHNAILPATLEGGWRGELWNRSKEGREFPISLSASPICDEDGRTIALVGIARDITENKRMEEAIRTRSEKLARSNEELDRFAYVASHDLQEPLRMVASFTQLLAKKYSGKLDETADRYINFAVDGAKRMQQLITDLLAYSRVNSKDLVLRATECEAVLRATLQNLRAAIDESGAVVECDPLPVLVGDAVQLGQLFQNLIGNAIKFRGQAPPSVHIAADDHGSDWLFSVRDNGIGIDPKHADRVFQIFQRLHTREQYPGTGIGLAVCKKVVERHGGRLWVESQPGAGSNFLFTLPKASTGQGSGDTGS
jgi:PAS domain S-box-containing protein